MKSNRFIQNTDLATLKNDAKTTAEITIPATTTIPNGVAFQRLVSTNFTVGKAGTEPQLIYEDEDGRIDTNSHRQISGTLRQYSTVDNQWHNTQWYGRIQVVRVDSNTYRLEAYVNVHWAYSRYNATFTTTQKKIKLYVHTFLNPFSQ